MLNAAARRKISFYASIISLVIVLLYQLIRFDLETSWSLLLKASGLAMLVLNLPLIIEERLNAINIRPFYKSEALWQTAVMFSLVILGLLRDLPIAGMLATLGLLAFFYNSFHFFREARLADIATMYMTLLLGGWIVVRVWNGGYLHPLFLEILPFDDRIHIDTLFHMSITQMIKFYGIPSTGLNGLPFFHYHFGSHYFFAQLSSLFHIQTIDFYNLCYPALFLPLLIKNILSLFTPAKHYLTWAVFIVLLAMIGCLPIFKYQSAAAANWFMAIVSESYNVSLVMMFMLLYLIKTALALNAPDKFSRSEFAVMSVLALILIFTIGLSKISTLFLLAVAAFYLLIRVRQLWKPVFFILAVAVILISIACLLIAMDPKSGDGKFELFSFYKSNVTINAGGFFFIYYFWSILAIGVSVWICRQENLVRQFPKRFYQISAEVIGVIACVGFIPGAIARIDGGSAGYFMDIQLWISVAYLVVIIPELDALITPFAQRSRLVAGGLILLLSAIVIIAHRQNYKSWKTFVKHNYMMRTWMAGEKLGDLAFAEHVGIDDLIRERPEMTQRLKKNLATDTQFQMLKNLVAIENPKTRGKSTFLVELENPRMLSHYPCYKGPFLIPALTGFALHNGFVYEDCHGTNYSFEYYKRNDLKDSGEESTFKILSIDQNGRLVN